MLKLLLLLAVVVAIAAIKPSAPVNFQDLDNSDVDAFLSDLSDELDVNDDAGSGTANDMSSCGSDRDAPCGASYYVGPDCKCDPCPSSSQGPQSSVYSPIKIDGRWPNVGESSCFSCDNGFKMDQGFCVKQDQSVTPYTHLAPEPPPEQSPEPSPSPQASPPPMRLEENLEESTHDDHKVKADSAVQSCAINACCLAGTYGTYGSCTNCPAGQATGYKPPSPGCYCLNTAASHCVSCTVCENNLSGECVAKCTGAKWRCSTVATNRGARPAGTCY